MAQTTQSEIAYETTEEKLSFLIQDTAQMLGYDTVADILTNGRADLGIDGGVDVSAGELRHIPSLPSHPDANEIVDSLERISLGFREPTPSHRVGFDWANAVRSEIRDLPTVLADQLIQAEIDLAEGTIFDGVIDFEEVLGLEQVRADVLGADNADERRELWDEILKFTEYEVTVTADGVNFYQTVTRQKSSQAHNDVLKRTRRTHGNLENVRVVTRPVRRYFPETDPLPDMEDFVFY